MDVVGLRVVRGPDWKWQNQDGGEGHVGTVVEVGRTVNSNTPEKTVVVQWDSGFRTNYRVGYQSEYDLLVWDRSPTGLKHPNVACDSCQQKGILGMRWKCSRCSDYDLCHSCYMNGKHDLSHAFYRFDSAATVASVKVSKRSCATRLEAKGIFPGAIVVRGPDWDWGNQDGGQGKHGKVLEIRGWDNESGRSVANVQWETGSTNVYRLGHKGKVDLKYITEATGGFYYREHLPRLGESCEAPASIAPPVASIFKVGDKVRVDLEVEVLRVMQDGHGGWNPKMTECIKTIGVVHRITDRGDIRVQFGGGGGGGGGSGAGQRWTFHSGALTKVPQFDVGDYVKISDDVTTVKQLQKGHGEWTENMKTVLGKLGKVVKIYPDEDIRIKISGQMWTFNPKCCMLVPNGQQELNNTLGGGNDRSDDHRGFGMQTMLEELLTGTATPCGDGDSPSLGSGGGSAAAVLAAGSALAAADAPDRLVREAAQGHTAVVEDIIARHPQTVNRKSSGKTALQVACHQGHLDIVQLLLNAEADLEMKDEDGDTALHYSAFGDQPEIMTILLKRGAFVNAVNNGGCTSLHVAVNKQHGRCVEVLLKHGSDVNFQDVYGDTALHDAVGKDNKTVTELLIGCPDVDFLLKNKRGFNVLHHASLKGNVHATELILGRSQSMVDIQKDDGYAALHLSSLNGHIQTTSALIHLGKGNIDITNSRKQTALLLATSQGHAAIVELLVLKGADVQLKDEDGQTCLHLALLRQAAPSQLNDAPEIQKIHSEVTSDGLANPPSLSLACFLLAHGLDLDQVSLYDNAQCIRLLSDNPLIAQLLSRYQSPRPKADGAGECVVCCESVANVLFLPCKHQIACVLCSSRMKKCLNCHATILQKIGPGGIKVAKQNGNILETKHLIELQQKLEKVEESQTCAICMENKWNVAFRCGHSACSKCAESLRVCHMCRKTINDKINLFT